MARWSSLSVALVAILSALCCSSEPREVGDASGDVPVSDTSVPDALTTDAPPSDTPVSPGATLASSRVGPGGAEDEVGEGVAAGAYVTIEPGALASEITVTIEEGTDIAHSDFMPVGPPLVFGPPGTAFSVPATLGIPFDATGVNTNDVRVLHRSADGTLETLTPFTFNGHLAIVQVSSFSTLQAVIPACPTGQTWCDTACVDTASDDGHCGSCHRDCGLGRECVESECVDAQLDFPDNGEVFVDDVRPGQLAVNGTHLYSDNTPYLESTQLIRADKATATTAPVAGLAGLIAVDDTWLYTMQSGYLMRRPTAGGDPAILLDNREGRPIWRMHLTSDHLWYVQQNSNFTGSLRRLDLESRTSEHMTGPLDPQGSIAVVGATVYWVNKGVAGQSAQLKRWTPGDAQHTPIVDVNSPSGLVADETHLYWVTMESAVGEQPSFGFSRMPVGGTDADVEVLVTGLDVIGAFVIDGTHIYYLSNGFDVRGLYRMPKTGGPPTVVVDNALQGGGLVQDGTHIYFSLHNGNLNGKIKRAAK